MVCVYKREEEKVLNSLNVMNEICSYVNMQGRNKETTKATVMEGSKDKGQTNQAQRTSVKDQRTKSPSLNNGYHILIVLCFLNGWKIVTK